MSATIHWEPVNKNPGTLYTLAPSAFMDMLKEVGCELPHEFDAADLTVLRALATGVGNMNRRPFDELIEAIQKYDRVRVWPEY